MEEVRASYVAILDWNSSVSFFKTYTHMYTHTQFPEFVHLFLFSNPLGKDYMSDKTVKTK